MVSELEHIDRQLKLQMRFVLIILMPDSVPILNCYLYLNRKQN